VLAAQRNPDLDEPGTDDLYDIGTVANILQLLKLPDGTVKVLVEGSYRAQLNAVTAEEDYFSAEITSLEGERIAADESEVMLRSAISQFEKYINLSKKIPAEVLTSLSGIDDPGRLGDTIAAHMTMELEQKQAVLEMANERERLEHLMGLMEAEIDLFQVERRIRGRVKKQMEKSQREYYLNEQMKAIQRELGESEEGMNELEELESRVQRAGMSKEALEKAKAELAKLKMMSPMSAEASVVRGYIDWWVSTPWQKRLKRF
jgi:ATP-dependent Lon protease